MTLKGPTRTLGRATLLRNLTRAFQVHENEEIHVDIGADADENVDVIAFARGNIRPDACDRIAEPFGDRHFVFRRDWVNRDHRVVNLKWPVRSVNSRSAFGKALQ
jgi:hypothetical protein